MLSGKVAPETVFDARDHRSLWSKEQIARWIEASSMFVQAVAEQGRQSTAQVALRFCLSYPAISARSRACCGPPKPRKCRGQRSRAARLPPI
jgi:Predicted oxidoreductases (related to aryl-alcohol dehydrogenases)